MLVFGELSQEDQGKFLEYMILNKVEFDFDRSDGTYIATIKITTQTEVEESQ
jgi:hypothetical protein